MSLYKHMHRLAAARDDESRQLAERVAAAEVLETTARIVYERAQAKAKELAEKQLEKKMADAEIQRLTKIRDDSSIPMEERYKAAAKVFQLIEQELKKLRK